MVSLVTGCAGFIAAKVAEQLLDKGIQVVGIDNLNDYYDPRLKEWRIGQLKKQDGFTFLKGDVGDLETVKRLFGDYRFSSVFNLAARAGVRASVADPWKYYDTNIKGTLNLLECCRQFDVERFMLASTSSIYGDGETPFRVGQSTDKPLSPYAATKKAAEALCYSYHHLYGIHIGIPRYFTVYGPAGRPDMSYFNFLLRMDRGMPIIVFGDGRQSRDFTYVDDVADATVRCLDLQGYHIFNVGNDRPTVLLDTIRMLEELSGLPADIEFQDRHPADNVITWADLSTTKSLLNWRPQVMVEDGMRLVVEWFKENRDWLRDIRI